jgi:dTDP-4-amino-4,6-dideoxygalactose transaminase
MKSAIPRGRISHSVTQEIRDLFAALFFSAEDDKLIEKYEERVSAELNSFHVLLYPLARTAIFSILEILRLPAGSKIIMPSITIKPILDVVVRLGFEPIFLDLDVRTGIWEVHELKRILSTERPRVALLTYLFGVIPDLGATLEILKQNGVIVIEDFSHAFGGKFEEQHVGTLGDFGICSTSSTKTFDTYGGAIVVASDALHYESLLAKRKSFQPPIRIQLLKKILRNLVLNLATQKFAFTVLTFPLIRFIGVFNQEAVGQFTGRRSPEPLLELPKAWFFRPFAFHAYIGLREIELLLQKHQRRIEIANTYNELEFSFGPRGSSNSTSTYWQYVQIEIDKNSLRKHLQRHRIDCSTTTLTNLTKLRLFGFSLNLEGTESIHEFGTYLPCYHQLDESDLNRIRASLREYYEG